MVRDRLGQPIHYGSLVLVPGLAGIYLVTSYTQGGSYCDLQFRTIEKPDNYPVIRAFSSELGGYSLTIRYDSDGNIHCEVLYVI